MADEVKKTDDSVVGLDSKLTPKISAAESSSSSTYDGPRAQQTDCAFDTTEDARYYKPIPEYEGAHRWDPEFEWTEKEEAAVVTKVCIFPFPGWYSFPLMTVTNSLNRSTGVFALSLA